MEKNDGASVRIGRTNSYKKNTVRPCVSGVLISIKKYGASIRIGSTNSYKNKYSASMSTY